MNVVRNDGNGIGSPPAASSLKPFTIRLGSGQKHTVRHQELVPLSHGGRHLILWIGDERCMDIDALLIKSLEPASGNGRRRRWRVVDPVVCHR